MYMLVLFLLRLSEKQPDLFKVMITIIGSYLPLLLLENGYNKLTTCSRCNYYLI